VTHLVSAIITTYNRADFVGQAIRSAQEQRLPDGSTVEVIVVDDESTDATPEVVRQFQSVRYVRQTNRKEGAARNTGAAAAHGTYLAFLDSDDYWLPGKLAGDVARFGRSDRPALVYSRAMNVDTQDRPLGSRRLATPEGDVFWALARESFVPMSSVAVRAEAFQECRGFNEDRELSGTADWELWLRMAARWPVGFADQTATCIRVHPAGGSMLADPMYMQPAMLAGVRYALADPVVTRRVRGREGYVRACMDVTLALYAYRHHRRAASLQWLRRAVLDWPPIVADLRFIGALGRTLLGRGMLGTLRPQGLHAQ
jgi:hypothetical protein